MGRVKNLWLPLFLLGLLAPKVALANAGVPMIFVVMPALGMSLIPIIMIESWYLMKRLNLDGARALKITVSSNLYSTLVGIPITWFLLLMLQFLADGGTAYGIETTMNKILSVTLQAAWLIPYETELYWMVPAAGLVLLVPFFFVSWWSEFSVSKKMLKEYPKDKVNAAVRNANLITYTLLAIWPISYLLLDQ